MRACVHARMSTVLFGFGFVVCVCFHSEIVDPLYWFTYNTREDSNVCYNPDIIM